MQMAVSGANGGFKRNADGSAVLDERWFAQVDGIDRRGVRVLPPQMASKLWSPAIPDRSDHRKASAHMQHLELRQSQCPLRPAQSRLFNWAGPTLLLYIPSKAKKIGRRFLSLY